LKFQKRVMLPTHKNDLLFTTFPGEGAGLCEGAKRTGPGTTDTGPGGLIRQIAAQEKFLVKVVQEHAVQDKPGLGA
jgi:hypothetical protein